jgi:hypothetical protein
MSLAVHDHGAEAFDPNQEEVYIPLTRSASLIADGTRYDLRPGMMARVGPNQPRKIVPGADGIQFIALGLFERFGLS